MKFTPADIPRYLLALLLLVFGANKFFGFLPSSEPPSEGAAYLRQLAAAGFIFPIVGAVLVFSGAMLLVGRAVGLALILFAPIAVNIVLYHLRYDPSLGGIAPGLVMAVLTVIVAWQYQDRFSALLR